MTKATPQYKDMADSYEIKKAASPCSCHTKKHKRVKKDAPKKKRTHSPSAYNLFVRKHYDSVRNIPIPQDRMRELGRRWKAQKRGRPRRAKPNVFMIKSIRLGRHG